MASDEPPAKSPCPVERSIDSLADNNCHSQQQQQLQQQHLQEHQEQLLQGPTPVLPKELFLRVIEFLEHDLDTLSTLLVVNRFFFNAAVRVLYRNPYDDAEFTFKARQERDQTSEIDKFDKSVMGQKLLFLLISSCENADELLPFICPDWENVVERPLMVPYVEYLKVVDLDEFDELAKSLFGAEIDGEVMEDILRKLQLMFLDSLAERVRMLSLPITHLTLYEPILPRLSRLEKILFYEDQVMDTTQTQQISVNSGIEFIKQHKTLFPGILQMIETPDSWVSDRIGNEETRDELVLSLQNALSTPTRIDWHLWQKIPQYFNTLPLNSLTTFRPPCNEHSHLSWNPIQIFSKCRSLQTLQFATTEPILFQWAVDESIQRDQFRELIADGTMNFSYSRLEPSLVPLKNLILSSSTTENAIQCLDDACFAFNDTLEKIQLKVIDNEPHRICRLDCLVDLHHIRSIEISFSDKTMLRPGTFENCSTLEILKLSSCKNLGRYSKYYESVMQPNHQPWYLPRLKILKLLGTSAKFFHFGTLASTKDLESIHLECLATVDQDQVAEMLVANNCMQRVRGESGNVGDEEEEEEEEREASTTTTTLMENQALTWDWDLPALRHITLRGLSAAIFEFKLLNTCPAIEELELELDTGLQRWVTPQDCSVGGTVSVVNEVVKDEEEEEEEKEKEKEKKEGTVETVPVKVDMEASVNLIGEFDNMPSLLMLNQQDHQQWIDHRQRSDSNDTTDSPRLSLESEGSSLTSSPARWSSMSSTPSSTSEPTTRSTSRNSNHEKSSSVSSPLSEQHHISSNNNNNNDNNTYYYDPRKISLKLKGDWIFSETATRLSEFMTSPWFGPHLAIIDLGTSDLHSLHSLVNLAFTLTDKNDENSTTLVPSKLQKIRIASNLNHADKIGLGLERMSEEPCRKHEMKSSAKEYARRIHRKRLERRLLVPSLEPILEQRPPPPPPPPASVPVPELVPIETTPEPAPVPETLETATDQVVITEPVIAVVETVTMAVAEAVPEIVDVTNAPLVAPTTAEEEEEALLQAIQASMMDMESMGTESEEQSAEDEMVAPEDTVAVPVDVVVAPEDTVVVSEDVVVVPEEEAEIAQEVEVPEVFGEDDGDEVLVSNDEIEVVMPVPQSLQEPEFEAVIETQVEVEVEEEQVTMAMEVASTEAIEPVELSESSDLAEPAVLADSLEPAEPFWEPQEEHVMDRIMTELMGLGVVQVTEVEPEEPSTIQDDSSAVTESVIEMNVLPEDEEEEEVELKQEAQEPPLVNGCIFVFCRKQYRLNPLYKKQCEREEQVKMDLAAKELLDRALGLLRIMH